MTAFENLVVVARGDQAAARSRAEELLDVVALRDVRDEYGANLSYGQQKLLEFVRLLMTDPTLVMLDEPFAGVNPTMERRLLEQMDGWLRDGKTIVVTDHEMKIMMEICEEIFVLDYGEVIAHGTPSRDSGGRTRDGGLLWPLKRLPMRRRMWLTTPAPRRCSAVHEIHAAYGKVQILDGVSLEVRPGEIVSIIGPNGAGKSTVLKSVMGILNPTRGEVVFDGEPITGLRTDLVVRRGIAYVPQGRIVFKAMSVVENLEMGAYTVKDKAHVRRTMEQVFAFFPRLGERRNQKAGTMSGGEQQMLAMGRALMVEPRLVLMDEPSLGLAPRFVEMVFDKLRELKASRHDAAARRTERRQVALDQRPRLRPRARPQPLHRQRRRPPRRRTRPPPVPRRLRRGVRHDGW